jgi:predicted RecB family nuclease
MFTRKQRWVTKTDIASYYRCPYAFWLVDTGQITFAETVSEFAMGLIRAGNAYQDLVEQSATEVVISPDDLAQLLRTNVAILGTPMFEDKRRKLRGTPDGIEAARGALYPVEIKSHRAVTHLDQLELAFYWILLDPHRTRRIAPAGVLILRREGKPVRVDVPITQALLTEVKQLIAHVRAARKHGVLPRACGCQVCSRLRRDEVTASVTERKDVTMIWGVGRVFAAALEAAGYSTWDSLAGCDPGLLYATLQKAGVKGFGRSNVEAWQLHARALVSGLPQFRPGAAWPVPPPYIALDLEYDVTPGRDHIWLTGACVVHEDGADHYSWWADTPQEERDALTGLTALLDRHLDLPVVTWSGSSADVPRLVSAAGRHHMPALADAVTERHLDAYVWAQHNVRLPLMSLGLKDVSGYLGYRPSTSITDGLDALMSYQKWCRTKDKQVQEDLIAYNRDDIGALVHTVAALAELAAAQPTISPRPTAAA